MPPLQPTHKGPKSSFLLGIAVIILVILGYIFFTASKGAQPYAKTDSGKATTTPITKETVVVNAVDINAAQTTADKLPAGFPSSIPLETKDIFVSKSLVYTDRTPNVILDTVSYRSSKTVSEKYDEYLAFMTKDGYTFGANGKDTTNDALYGTKGTSSLLVVVSSSSGQTAVELDYTAVK